MAGFFFDEVVNDWGELTYVPTTAGKCALLALFVILVVAAVALSVYLNKKKKESGEDMVPSADTFSNAKIKKTNKSVVLTAKQLAFCAVAIALGTVLSNVKLFHFPTGGSITLLSMLVICLPGYWFGLGAGIITGIAYGVLQLVIDPYVLYPAQLVVDYILAFGALGLSGLFSNKRYGLIYGYITGITGRFIFAVISGCVFFGAYAWDGWNPFAYSLAYNAIYIYAEGIITVIILCIPPVRKAMGTIKSFAVE